MKLKELREKENYTQTYLANKLGVTSQTILNWENEIYEPNIKQLIFLADLFNVSIDYLVERKSNTTIINECIKEVEKIEKEDFIYFIKQKLTELRKEELEK